MVKDVCADCNNNRISYIDSYAKEFIEKYFLVKYKKDDTGAGTNFKGLIIFDLALLRLTELPAIAHDCNIFKNITVLPIDKIMELYNQSKKQILLHLIKKIHFMM